MYIFLIFLPVHSGSYIMMFLAFFFVADMAARKFFNQNPREVLENSKDTTLRQHICLAHIYHRMEASFGIGQGVIALSATAIFPSFEVMSGVLFGITISNLMVTINHGHNYFGSFFFGVEHKPETKAFLLKLFMMAFMMTIISLILCVLAFTQATFSVRVKY